MDTPYEVGVCTMNNGEAHRIAPCGPHDTMACMYCSITPAELFAKLPKKHALGGLSFADYDNAIASHRHYPLAGQNVVYPVMGLCADAAKLLFDIQQHWRQAQTDQLTLDIADCDMLGASIYDEQQRRAVAMKMGGVLWHLHCLAHEFGYSLTDIAAFNIVHLQGERKP